MVSVSEKAHYQPLEAGYTPSPRFHDECLTLLAAVWPGTAPPLFWPVSMIAALLRMMQLPMRCMMHRVARLMAASVGSSDPADCL